MNNTRALRAWAIALVFGMGIGCAFRCAGAEDAVVVDLTFELPPVVDAKAAVPPELFESKWCAVSSEITIANSYYRFHLDSTTCGRLEVDSLDMLRVRAHEVDVLAAAVEVKTAPEVASGAKTDLSDTAKAAAKSIVKPVTSAKALGASLEEDARTAYDIIRWKKRNQPSDSWLTGEEKRRDAHNLGLDPYSTNPCVQAYLDQLAKTRAAGSRTVDVAIAVGTFVMPFGTPVSAVIKAGKYREKLDDKLDTMSPMELYHYNDKLLRHLNVASHDREVFLECTGLTPIQKTEIVADLKPIEAMPDKAPFLHACAGEHPAEGIWQVQCADMLAKYNKTEEAIQSAEGLESALVAKTTGGRRLLVLPGDIIYWSEGTAKVVEKAKEVGAAGAVRECVTCGRVTARAKLEIEARGFVVRESFLNEPAPTTPVETK